MTSSLVGSEMCIRDRSIRAHLYCLHFECRVGTREHDYSLVLGKLLEAVSYTHLTLPTICSV
eukprot:2105813-Prorocentrum_lima.AAC.1